VKTQPTLLQSGVSASKSAAASRSSRLGSNSPTLPFNRCLNATHSAMYSLPSSQTLASTTDSPGAKAISLRTIAKYGGQAIFGNFRTRAIPQFQVTMRMEVVISESS
jgi:hypothetical protein